MPTEVFELSPQQLDWLYEHQTLKTVDGFHHLEVISPTATPHPTPKPVSPPRNQHFVDLRRDSMTHDSCTASSTSHTSMRTQSPELEGIIFPFNDERPSWEQSLSNLLCYKERHGHCNVPRFYPTFRQLGSWVHRQRLKKKFPNKYGALKKEQIQKLEALGFVWRVRKDSR